MLHEATSKMLFTTGLELIKIKKHLNNRNRKKSVEKNNFNCALVQVIIPILTLFKLFAIFQL